MAVLVPYRGIVEIVGEHDTGKTIAMLQTAYPYKKTVFVDDDVKGDATIKQWEEMEGKSRQEIFAEYIDLREWRAKLGKTPTPTQLLEKVVDPVVEHITKKKYEVIVWDTARIIYQSARGHVEKHQSDYRDVVKWQGSSTIIQGLVSRVARTIEQSYLTRLKDSCELLLVSHHIKDWYVNNVVVGVKPESSGTYSEICTMRMWLRRNPQSKVPIILFLKRPSIPVKPKAGGRPKFKNIVPPKITPIAADESIWDAIERYERNPIESRELRPDEQPTKEEMTLISETLSDDQRSYMMEVLKNAPKEKEVVETVMRAYTGGTKAKKSVPPNGGPPQDGLQLILESMSSFGIDVETIARVIDVPEDDVMSLEGKEVEDAWEKIKEHAADSSGE